MSRVCSECPNKIDPRNVSGFCRTCSSRRIAKAMHADPDVAQRRRESLARHFECPENRQRRAAHLAQRHATMTESEQERRSEWGRHLHRVYLANPEMQARIRSPESRAKAGRTITENRLGWCPPERWDEYRSLLQKHVPAVEARAMIEADIPGTEAHARRVVANSGDVMRIREERRKAQAY